MANEFRPGHPVLFWGFVVIFTFSFFSAATAWLTLDDCPRGTPKTWTVLPPVWDCGGTGTIQLTR